MTKKSIHEQYLNRNKKLHEELHVDNLVYLGTGYGYDLYRADTYQAAQALTVNGTETPAGQGWTNSEQTFNNNITGDLHIYFFTRENTNAAIVGCLNTGSSNLKIADKNYRITVNYSFQHAETAGTDIPNWLPLYLLPDLQHLNGHDGLIIDGETVKGNYKGLLNPNNLPENVEINDNRIVTGALTGYPVASITIGDNVDFIESGAFTGYAGRILCVAEQRGEDWSQTWNGDNNNIEWAINLDPEERARRAEAARLEQERIAREEQERLERERRERELQVAEVVNVLKFREEGNHIVILGCKKGRQELNIPEEINGKKVTEIGPFAFYNNKALTKVILPPSVKTIGKGAFMNCSNCYVYYPKSAVLYSDALTNVRSRSAR